MTAGLSLYQKAEKELYKLDRQVKAQFYDFSHQFRDNPHHPSLHLKQLKGDPRIFSARIGEVYRALLTRTGIGPKGEETWLVIAVRHRKDVYEQLSVAVNRITGEIEFVDLSVVGDSALRRAGIELTPAEPNGTDTRRTPAAVAPDPRPEGRDTARPLLAGHTVAQLRDLGVAEPLIDLALAVTTGEELDQLVDGAPLLSKDVLYGLAIGMSTEQILAEITGKVAADQPVDTEDFAAALNRTTVTTVDDAINAVLEEGDFRTWKVFLHPTQRRLVDKHYSGPARVSGGPGTGKTIVALHRVAHLAGKLDSGRDKPILLTTFTKNLATDLRSRLASLIGPEMLARVEVVHVDQLANRVIGENMPPGRGKSRVDDKLALLELRDLLAELDDHRWEPEFLKEEWEQVILGQSILTRAQYFQARRAGRGRPLTRPDRDAVWKIIEQYTARLNKRSIETWAQAAERAARLEIERATRIGQRRNEAGGPDLPGRDDSSGMRNIRHRYRHIVVDEAQDLSPAHWKMLRAMVQTGPDDLFLVGDTHQRIYDNQVSLGAVGVNIRGRSARLTLSYRTTREILASALTVMTGETFDDLDDGTDTLAGYRSVLHGPAPALTGYPAWTDELDGLATTIRTWLEHLTGDDGRTRDPRGLIAVCVADRAKATEVMHHLESRAGISCAELTRDGPRGDGDIHVGTMHRFKGLEYQRLAIVAVSDGIVPRAAIERYRDSDPPRYLRERRKARALLFVAETRARDTLSISWHGAPSPFLAAR